MRQFCCILLPSHRKREYDTYFSFHYTIQTNIKIRKDTNQFNIILFIKRIMKSNKTFTSPKIFNHQLIANLKCLIYCLFNLYPSSSGLNVNQMFSTRRNEMSISFSTSVPMQILPDLLGQSTYRVFFPLGYLIPILIHF